MNKYNQGPKQTTRINYRGIAVDLTITRDYFEGIDHIEVQTLDNHPIPLTETGYRSHFCFMGENFTMDQAIEWFYQENGKKDSNGFQDDFFSSVPHEPQATESIKQDETIKELKTFNSEPLIKPGAKANQPTLF